MKTKIFRRNVSVIEVHRDSKFLGYYTGRDKKDNIHFDNRLLYAMAIKTTKGGKHILYNLNKFHSDEYAFNAIDCLETFTTTYYDEYDEIAPEKVDAYFVLRIKKKDDMLSEPCYLSVYDKKEITFESSLNIEKAILTGEYRSNNMLYHLSRKYADKYEFYIERLFIWRTRELQTID